MTEPANAARPAFGTETAVQIEKLNKWYGTFHVLRDIDLTVRRGERIVIAGPSGSGKSTLIRCINQLEEHQSGRITVDGIELTNDIKNIDKVRSEVGMVFQHFNLFPHKSVLQNITLAPVLTQGQSRTAAERRQGQDGQHLPAIRGNRPELHGRPVAGVGDARETVEHGLRSSRYSRGRRCRKAGS